MAKTTGAKAPSPLNKQQYIDDFNYLNPAPAKRSVNSWQATNDFYKLNGFGPGKYSNVAYSKPGTRNGNQFADEYFYLNGRGQGKTFYVREYPTFTPREKPKSFLANPTDPFAVDNFGEALLTMFNKNMNGHGDNPFKNLFTDVWNIMHEQTLKPIGAEIRELFDPEYKASREKAGNGFAQAGLNALMNIGNSLDAVTFSNTVKAVVLGSDGKFGGGDGGLKWDNIQKSLWGTKAGTELFEAKYDNGLGSFAVEMLLDVGNWVTLGGKALATSGVDDVVKQMSKQVDDGFNKVYKVGKGLVDKAPTEFSKQETMIAKSLAKKSINAYVRGDYDTMNEAFQAIVSKYGRGKYIMPIDGIPKEKVMKFIGDSLLASKEVQANKIVSSVRKLTTNYNKYEDTMLKLAMDSTGYRPMWLAGKGTYKWLSDKNMSAMYNHLTKYIDDNGNIDINKMSEAREQLEQFMAVNNMANKLDGGLDITAEDIDKIFDISIGKQLAEVDELITKYMDDPVTLNKEIGRIFRIDNPNNMQEAYGIINDIVKNMSNPEDYRNILEATSELLENYKTVLHSGNMEKLIAGHQKAIDAFDSIKNYISELNSPDIMGNIEHYMEQASELWYHKGTTPFVAQAELAKLRNHVDTYVNQHIAPIVDALDNIHYDYETMKIINEIKGYFNQYISDMYTSLDSPKWQAEFIEDLMYGQGFKLLDPPPIPDEILEKLNRLTNRLANDFKKFKTITEDIKPCQSLNKFVDATTKEHGKYVDNFMKKVDNDIKYKDAFVDKPSTDYVLFPDREDKFQVLEYLQNLTDEQYVGLSQTLSTLNKHNIIDVHPDVYMNKLLDLTNAYMLVPEEGLTNLAVSLEEYTNMLYELQTLSHKILSGAQGTTSVNMFTPSEIAMLEQFTNVQIKKLEQKVIEGQINGKVYQLQLERSWASATIANDPEMLKFLKEMKTNTGIGLIINDLAKVEAVGNLSKTDQSVIEAAKQLKFYSDILANYYDFQQSMTLLPISTKSKSHFMSAVQWLGDMNPDLVQSNFDYYFDNIIEKAEMLGYAKHIDKSLKIDDLLTPEMLDNVDRAFKGVSAEKHTAVYDCYQVEELVKNEPALQKVFDTFKDDTIVLFDIETSGSKHYSSSINQIGAKVYGEEDTIDLWKKFEKGGVDVPSDTVLETFFPDLIPSERMKAWLARQEKYGEFSEAESIRNFIAYLKAKEKPVLAGHNVNAFDSPMIQAKMRKYIKEGSLTEAEYQYFMALPRIDTLQILQEKNGMTKFTAREKNILKRTLKRYADKQVESPTGKFIATASYDFIEQAASLSKLLLQETAYVKNKGNEFARKAAEVATDLKSLSDTTKHNMREIKQLNKTMRDTLIFEELLKDSNYQDKLVQFLKAEGYSDEIVKHMSGYLNASKLMYGAVPDGMYMYGYRTIVDPTYINNWFDPAMLPANVKYTRGVAEKMTSIGKSLTRTAESVKNVGRLQEIGTERLQKAIDEVFKLYEFDPTLLDSFFNEGAAMNVNIAFASYYSALKVGKQNITEQWALLQHLWNKKHTQSLLTSGVFKTDGIDKQLLEILTNPVETNKIYSMDFDFIKSDDPLKYRFEDGTVNVTGWEYLGEDIGRMIESNENLAKQFEDLGITDNQSQLIAQTMLPIKAVMDEVTYVMQHSTPEGRKALADEIYKTTNNMQMDMSLQILQLQPEQLFNFMVAQTPYVTLSYTHLPVGHPIRTAVETIQENKTLYKELGIELYDDGDRFALHLSKDIKIDTVYDNELKRTLYYINGKSIVPPRLEALAYDVKGLSKLNDAVNNIYKITNGEAVGSTLNLLTKEKAYALYKRLPEKLQKVINQDMLQDLNRYQGTRFNFANLGDLTSVRSLDQYASTSMLSALRTNGEYIAAKTQTKMQYTQHFFNNAMSVNSEAMKNVSKEQLTTFLQNNPNFVLVSLVADKIQGYKAVPINPTVTNWFETAKRLNAIMLPTHTYSTMNHVINETTPGPMMNIVRKIMTTYKLGYLFRPVTVFNNYVDSTLKTAMTTGRVLDTFRYQLAAPGLLKQYDSVLGDVLNFSQIRYKDALQAGVPKEVLDEVVKLRTECFRTSAMDLFSKYTDIASDLLRMDYNRKLTTENIQLYFKEMHPAMDFDTYKLIDTYVKSNASSGMTPQMQQYMQKRMTKNHEGMEKVWDGYLTLSNMIMAPMEWVEKVNRFATYMMENEKGYSVTDSIANTVKTHFDYASKSDFAKIMEMVFPFFSFTQKNINYYLELIADKPHLTALMFKYANSTWHFEEYKDDELSRNMSLQNQILNGMLPFNDKGDVMKIRPSFMEVFNIYTDPINSGMGKVFGPYKELSKLGTGAEVDIAQLLPYVGTLQNTAKAYETNDIRAGEQGATNPLSRISPAIFGVTKRWRDFPPREPKVSSTLNLPKPSKKSGWIPNKYGTYRRDNYANGRGGRGYYNSNRMYTPSKYFPKYNNTAYRPTLEAGRGYDPMNYNTNYQSKVRIYDKQYTKKGKSRMDMRMRTPNGHNLTYIINDWKYCR